MAQQCYRVWNIIDTDSQSAFGALSLACAYLDYLAELGN